LLLVAAVRVLVRLTFSVGDRPVPNFQMVERHYFKSRLIKSFDFKFVFCIPNSVNTWDTTYELPPLDDALGACACPCCLLF
jgi:hypothetical protein